MSPIQGCNEPHSILSHNAGVKTNFLIKDRVTDPPQHAVKNRNCNQGFDSRRQHTQKRASEKNYQ